VQYLKDAEFKQLYTIVSDKIAELQAQSSQPGSSTQAFVIQMKTTGSHLRARLSHFVVPGPWPESITMSHISLLHSSLDSILQCVTSLEEEQEKEGSSKQGDVAKERQGNSDCEIQAASSCRNDATQHVAATDESERGSNPTDHSNTRYPSKPTRVMGVSQVTADTNSMLLSQIYQRLPHPLTNLFKEIPAVDGTDVNTFWEFLSKAIHIRHVGQIQDQHILELLYPYCHDS
jgi:hypothetical protein